MQGHGDDLTRAMRHCRTILPRLSTLYSHADWDPEATLTTVHGEFRQLEVLVATDFLAALQSFADVQGSASTTSDGSAADTGAAPDGGPPVEEKRFMWSKYGREAEEYGYSMMQTVSLRLQDQKVILIEDFDGSDGYVPHPRLSTLLFDS
jgi:hypothetical protein